MAIKEKPRIIIWFVSNDGRFIGNAINILTRQFNGVEIIGATATQKILKYSLPFIPLNEISLNGGGYDILLVAGARNFGMSEVVKFAKSIKLDTEKLLGDWIVCIPGFTLPKYRQLQRSKLSIFSVNCFGGLISNLFGLPFRAPFVNMFLSAEDYIKFLSCPRVYLEENLVLKEIKRNDSLNINYPVYLMGNVVLNMNHYPDSEEALKTWYKRKQRINWYNLFVTAYTEKLEILEQFDALPYGKKVCFVTFKSDLDSAFYINPDVSEKVLNKKLPLWDIVNHFAQGIPFYYDMFDMLLYGKKTQLIDM